MQPNATRSSFSRARRAEWRDGAASANALTTAPLAGLPGPAGPGPGTGLPRTAGRRRDARPARLERRRMGMLAVALIALGLAAGPFLEVPRAEAQTSSARGARPAARPGDSRAPAIQKLIGVGQVLTTDGRILSYDPQRRLWQDIDEAFRAQGKTTRVLPLPVAVDEIREMVTFGFLVTTEGDCWVYDLQEDRWAQAPPLPAAD